MKWHKFTGRYDKQYYLLRYGVLKLELVLCYPNGGLMNEWGGENRSWSKDDDVEVMAIPDTMFKAVR